MCSTHCCFSFESEWQEYECQRLAITPPFRSQLEEGSNLMGGMEWQTETMFPSPNKMVPSLKLTFSQLTIECLEDYILSFNRSSFQVRREKNCHPIGWSPRRLHHYLFHQVKTSALSRRLCFLAGKEWRIFVHPRENRRVVSKARGFFSGWLGVFLLFKLLLLCSQCGVASSL